MLILAGWLGLKGSRLKIFQQEWLGGNGGEIHL